MTINLNMFGPFMKKQDLS